MAAGAEFAGIAHHCDRGTCLNLVTGGLEQLFVMFVNGYDIVTVLYLEGISGVIAPTGGYYRTIKYGMHYGTGLGRNIYIRMTCCLVVSFGNYTAHRSEEVQPLDLFYLLPPA